MRVRRSFLACLLMSATCAHSQDPAKPVPFLGTKTPYHPQQRTYTPPPPGYSAVFVNYVGRHGARYLTKEGTESGLLAVLSAAREKNGLTSGGEQLSRMIGRLMAVEKGNYENITLLGGEEQEAIGQRLRLNYPGAFTGRGLRIVTTYKVRTQQSARALLRSFGSGYGGNVSFVTKPDSLDTLLRFYDLSPEYQVYKKSELVKRVKDSLSKDPRMRQIAVAVCAKVFTPAYAKQFVDERALKMDAATFVTCLYDLYSVQFSLRGELQQQGYGPGDVDPDGAGLGGYFEPAGLAWLDFVSGAEDFIEKGPGLRTGAEDHPAEGTEYPVPGIQVLIAAPLLADFITTTDNATHDHAHADAILRFTHAEAIAPFAALMGIPADCHPVASIYDYHAHWDAGSIIPLSANVQWILYTNGKDWLVKVLLNEKEMSLPLAGATGPYYSWTDVAQYYHALLFRLMRSPHFSSMPINSSSLTGLLR